MNKLEITTEMRKLEIKLQNNKINHVLHLILTILTGGLWVVVWILLALFKPSDESLLHKIAGLEGQLTRLDKETTQGWE